MVLRDVTSFSEGLCAQKFATELHGFYK